MTEQRRRFTCTRCALMATVILSAMLVPAAAQAYVGMLNGYDGGLTGTGNWFYEDSTWIEWGITQNTDSSWHYSYDFGHPEGATSHFILEVSDTFTANDIFGESGDFADISIGTHEVGSGNFNMPESIYGIKFDEAWGNTSHFEFDSFRVPVWGDFYSKNGSAGGHGPNTAWNSGFTTTDYDPIAAAQDGSIEYHILVPDSQGPPPPVPEPATLMLMGTGLAGLIAARKRRR